MTGLSQQQIGIIAQGLKDAMRTDIPEKDAALGNMLVDVVADLFMKLAAIEHHIEDIAYSQRMIAGR